MQTVKRNIGVITRINMNKDEKVCSATIAEIKDGEVVESPDLRDVSDMCYNLQNGYFVVINEDGSIADVLNVIDMPLSIEEMRIFKGYFTNRLIEERKKGNMFEASNYYTTLENIKYSFKIYDSFASSPAPSVNYIK